MNPIQLNIGIILVLLAIPVYFLDQHLLKPSGGFLPTDLRGLLFWGYVILITLYLFISSIGISYYQKSSLLSIHLVSGLLSIILIVAGWMTIAKIDQMISHKKYETRMAERAKLFDVIQLKEWWLVPDPENPVELHIKITVTESGRFAGGIQGRYAGDDGKLIFAQDEQHQFQVKAGETFEYVSILKRYNSGIADDWTISLSLFKDDTGSALEDISKIFINNPETPDDEHFFYGELPEMKSDD